MISLKLDRRTFLFTLGLAGLATHLGAQPRTLPPVERTEIDVGSRKVPLFLWRAPETKAVVVFSHGAGADPEAYGRLLRRWRDAGISVVAPLHVDLRLHPDHEKYTLASAFAPRWRDMTEAVAFARAIFPGMKIGAAGHSYGSLFAEMMAGALPGVFGPPKAPLDAVVTFSSPGKIQPLVRADSFKGLTVPLLALTGDRDVGFGAVTDWHDHLYAYETAPAGDKYAWVGRGVDHLYGGAIDRAPSPTDQNAQFDEAAALSTQFLRAYLENDTAARTALATRADTPLGHFAHR